LYQGNKQTQRLEANTAGTEFGSAFLGSEVKALTEVTAMKREFAQKYPEAEFDNNQACLRELQARDEAMRDTIDWVQQNKKLKQFLVTDADEEGLFQIAKVPVGNYSLVARGRAGTYDAEWSTEVSVKPGSTESVKLSAPAKSCATSPD
jgi:hypothetical protein